VAEGQLDAERAFSCGGWTKNGKNGRAQTLHPEKSQRTDEPEQD
jgi:hypothetical protein